MESNTHKIYARHSGIKAGERLSIPLIKRCVRETLSAEGVDVPCEVSVLITDDKSICAINSQFRGIESPTDVLSFPMQQFTAPGWASPGEGLADPGTGLLPLGEIALSAERVISQAGEYGHTKDRETAYLTVHSVLHLLGYDHTDEAEGKKLMRTREKLVMEYLRDTGGV